MSDTPAFDPIVSQATMRTHQSGSFNICSIGPMVAGSS